MNKKTISNEKQEQILRVMSSYGAKELQAVIVEQMRTAALRMALNLLEEEASNFCGEPYSHGGQYLRGGSENGSVVINGAKYKIKRPRVRTRDAEEVKLSNYQKLRSQDILDEQISGKMLLGISTRNYSQLQAEYGKRLGVSKSSISRAFGRESAKILDDLNHSDLSGHSFLGLVLDGIEVAGKTVVACLGITDELKKVPLGLREGSSENAEVVKDLLSSLVERNLTFACENILVLLDGSKALNKAIKSTFGSAALIQRCWLHKDRNIKSYLPKQYHQAAHRKLKLVMSTNSYTDAKAEYKKLFKWLENISVDAASSLEEAGEELLTLHKLGVTGELRKSLSSTNMIESLFSDARASTRRVKNWNQPGQSLRWFATVINNCKTKFKRLRGTVAHGQLLIKALKPKLIIESLAA